jgi:hypothetical protein
MMDSEVVKWFASLGVGGVLAGILFFFYRKDVRFYMEQWKGYTDKLIEVVTENTRANTELRDAVRALHKRLDADEARTRIEGRHFGNIDRMGT